MHARAARVAVRRFSLLYVVQALRCGTRTRHAVESTMRFTRARARMQLRASRGYVSQWIPDLRVAGWMTVRARARGTGARTGQIVVSGAHARLRARARTTVRWMRARQFGWR